MAIPLQNTQSKKTPASFDKKQSAGIRIDPGPYIGVVKNNIDSMRAGRLQVYINKLGGNPDDSNSWRTVQYCSPFFGVTPAHYRGKDQKFPLVPHSYGMWFVPPDVGVQVLCIFVDGDPNFGYWFACIPEWPNLHMVPGLASGKWRGGGPEPLTDYNDLGDESNSSLGEFYKRQTTVHDYQKEVWKRQGLLTDPERGPGISTAFRETPSRVFGISTPGPEISPSSGSEDDTINLDILGRQGGHQFVMDDGTVDGKSQLIRLRTSNGNMILMNDSAGFIYIINSTGSAWFEMDKTGNIKAFSQGQIQMHGTAGITLSSTGAVKISGTTVDIAATASLKMKGATVDVMGMAGVKVGGMGDLHLSGKKALLSGKMCVGISGKMHIDMKAGCITLNTKMVTDASAPGAATPGKGPTHEPYPQHINSRTNAPVTSAGYGAVNGVPEGASGNYGATASFGLTPNTPGYYGVYTNANGPIKFNPGLQSSFEGQAANLGTAAALNEYDRYAVSYTNVNIKLPVAQGGFAVDVQNKQVAEVAGLTPGEKQNNPGDLTGITEDQYALGVANGLNVYSNPEDGIAALSQMLDLIQADGASTVAEFIDEYLKRRGKVV